MGLGLIGSITGQCQSIGPEQLRNWKLLERFRQETLGRNFAMANTSQRVYSTAMTAARFRIALVTAPDLKTTRRLARAALKARLIACANLVPKIESHYWWEGKIERGAEVLLILKTTKTNLAKLEKLILSEHPYDTPEFIVLPLETGNHRYLDWITANTSKPLLKTKATAGMPNARV